MGPALFGDDWRQCFLDFVVAGPDPDRRDDEEDPFWVLSYPDHDFDEDDMEQSRLRDFLIPEPARDAIDVDAVVAAEEAGRDLNCKECESHVAQGLDCSSCSAKYTISVGSGLGRTSCVFLASSGSLRWTIRQFLISSKPTGEKTCLACRLFAWL